MKLFITTLFILTLSLNCFSQSNKYNKRTRIQNILEENYQKSKPLKTISKKNINYKATKEKLVSETDYTIENGDTIADYKIGFDYDETFQLKTLTEYYFENTWVADYIVEFEFDENGNELSNTSKVFNENTQEWDLSAKYFYNYKGDHIENQGYCNWNDSLQQWDTLEYRIYFIENDKVIEEHGYSAWAWDSLILETKREHNYSNNLLQYIDFYYLDATDWELQSRDSSFYNQQNEIIASHYYYYQNNTWEKSIRTTYSPNADKPEDILYYNSNFGADWNKVTDKRNYEYDQLNNPTHEIYWDVDENNEFYESSTYSYTYDQNVNVKDLITIPLDFFLPDYSQHINSKMLSYSSVSNYIGEERQEYYGELEYELIEVGIKNNKKESFNLFPNPFTNTININVEIPSTLLVYNQTGKLVHKETINYNTSVNLTNLNNGVYIYEIVNSNSFETGKLIKQ